MSESVQDVYRGVISMIEGVASLDDGHGYADTKIGSASRAFNTVLGRAKLVCSSSTVRDMAQLTDIDTVVALVTHLQLLRAELAGLLPRP